MRTITARKAMPAFVRAKITIAKHHELSARIKNEYKKRDIDDSWLVSCDEHIAMSRDIVNAITLLFQEIGPRGHDGYRKKIDWLERLGRFDEAIDLCRRAESDGWGSHANTIKDIESASRR